MQKNVPSPLPEALDEDRYPIVSREDLDLILQHHNVTLDPTLADRLYEALPHDSLYLNLAVQALAAPEQFDPAALITRVTQNPDDLFALAIAHLKRQPLEWREVLKPLLGLLLAARDPLSQQALATLLHLDDVRLHEGLQRLGALLTPTEEDRYALSHSQFRNYLSQNEQEPHKTYIFAADEEQHYHAILAAWCEQGDLERIWRDNKNKAEQERRVYARKHLVAHLYFTHRWDRLFAILDDSNYGHAKERYDLSTRSYCQDLDFGSRASSWTGWTPDEAFAQFPHLLQYTLLHCILKNQSNNYPDELLKLLFLLGREQEAIARIEQISDPARKARIFQTIATHILTQAKRRARAEQLFQKAEAAARSISGSEQQAWALSALVTALIAVKRWSQAEAVAHTIPSSALQAAALSEIATALQREQRQKQAGRIWQQSETLARSIAEDDEQAWVSMAVASDRAQFEQAEHTELSRQAEQTEHTEVSTPIGQTEHTEPATPTKIAMLPLPRSYSPRRALQDLLPIIVQAERWEQVEPLYKQAEAIALSSPQGIEQAATLSSIGIALIDKQPAYARKLCLRAEAIARLAPQSIEQVRLLRQFALALAKTEQWQEAENVAHAISRQDEQVRALTGLALAFTKAERLEQAKTIWQQAEALARSIPEDGNQTGALSEIILAAAQVGRWEQAHALIEVIIQKGKRLHIVESFVVLLVKAGRWEQAQSLALSIRKDRPQAKGAANVAVALAEVDPWEQVEEVVRGNWWNDEYAAALNALTRELGESGRGEQAEGVWQRAEEQVYAITNRILQARALRELGQALTMAERREQAERVWQRAETVATAVFKKDEQAKALRELAQALSEAGRWEQAERVWQRAEESGHSILKEPDRARVVTMLAWTSAKAGRQEQAAPSWQQAEQIARSLSDGEQRASALVELAMALAESDQVEKAVVLVRSTTPIPQNEEHFGAIIAKCLNTKRYAQAVALVQHFCRHSEQQTSLLRLFSAIIVDLVSFKPDLGLQLYQSVRWVDTFLGPQPVATP